MMSAPPVTPPAPPADNSSPGFLASLGKSVNNLVGGATAVPQAVGSVIANAPKAVQTEQTDTAQIKQGPAVTGAEATGLALGVQDTLAKSQAAAKAIGNIEQSVAAPQAQNIINSATGQITTGTKQYQDAVAQYQQTQQDVNQKAQAAENALTYANQKANINPQQYLDTMGVDQKTVTALGMVLSGIGSGLTGQPNMAMQAFQANVDRNIAAQKQVFLNRMQAAAQAQGLLQTAQDKARLDLQAQQFATITVNNGISNLVSGTQMKTAALSAPYLSDIINNKSQQDGLGALGQYNQAYINTYNSGDKKNLDLLGIGADVATRHFTGAGFGNNPGGAAGARAANAAGMPGSQYSLSSPATSSPQFEPQTANPALSTTQNKVPAPGYAPPPSAGASSGEKENFLSAVAKKVQERKAEGKE